MFIIGPLLTTASLLLNRQPCINNYIIIIIIIIKFHEMRSLNAMLHNSMDDAYSRRLLIHIRL